MFQICLFLILIICTFHTNDPCFPKRDYLNRCRSGLQLIHSFPDPKCIFESVAHQNLLCLHNSHAPRNDDLESSFADDYISQILSSHFYLLNNPLWSIPNTWKELKHTYEYDLYKLFETFPNVIYRRRFLSQILLHSIFSPA